jgi:glycosyltransferase involved in cell wall biosynthesis
MNKPKILFLIHWPPPIHGSSVIGLQIKESNLINTGFDCNYINLGTSKSIDEIGKNAIRKIFNYLAILLKVLKILLTNRPNLCYFAITAKGIGFYKDDLVVLLIKLFRVKIVYHFHNKGVSLRQKKFFDNLLYRLTFKNTDAILLSRYLYSDIESFFPQSKIHICPNGIPEMNNSLNLNRKKKNGIVKILFLSNLIESKGVFILLEACSILKQKGVIFKCDFVGGEGDITTTQFQNKVELLGLSHCVSYLGGKFGEEKNKVFNDADIFAFPTYNETFGIVLLEAMKYNLPVVSTFEGGIPDVVEDNATGFLVQQKNQLALAVKLEVLIENYELRCKMGKAGKEKFEREFTLQKFEIKLTEILHQILGN